MGNSETTEKSFYLYPTVFSGNMDISKAKKMLGFVPTSAEEAFKATLAWYEEAFVKFPSNRDSILTDLFQTAIPKENRFVLRTALIDSSLDYCFRDAVYLAIDRELTRMGHTEEKYAKKKKGDLGSLPTVTKGSDDAADRSKDEL